MRWRFVCVLCVWCVWASMARAQQCRLCEHGTFCFLDAQYLCPTNSHSLPGSGNVTDCVCLPGYFSTQHVDNDHTCRPCEPGRYCPGDETSLACPQHSWSDAFAAGLTDCFCVPGHAEVAGGCVPCEPGTHKTDNGPQACGPCQPDSFSAAPGAGACTRCPPNTNTQDQTGSVSELACVSNAGYYSDGGTITPCAAGTFQPQRNQAGCLDCRQGGANNRYTTGTASVSAQYCLTCPADSAVPGETSGSSLASCLCDAGFTGPDGGECAACAPGLVKADVGSAACVACIANQYADPTNTQCIACTADSSSPPESDNRTACICNAGFSSGLVAPFACTQCAAGTYQLTLPPALSTCEACAAGKFSSQDRRTVCTDCAANSFQSNTGKSVCSTCPTSSVSQIGSILITACLCNPGFERVGANCAACKTGFFKSATSNAVCTQCGMGLVSPHTSTSDSQCVLCATGLYVETLSSGLLCSTCQQHAQAPTGGTGISSCACRAGFTGAGQASSISYDQFTNHRTSSTWTAYAETTGAKLEGPINIYSGGIRGWTGSTHEASISWTLPSQFQEFEVNFMNTIDSGNSLSRTILILNDVVIAVSLPASRGGSRQIIRRSYIAGKLEIRVIANSNIDWFLVLTYYSTACQACPSGSYKAGSGNQTCTLCPAGYIGASMSSPGFAAFLAATGADALVRTSEHYCQACGVGSYEAGGVCVNCHNGSSSTSASVGASACSCVAGHEPVGGGCAACLAGHYKTGGGNVACSKCGMGTYSAVVGAVLASVCQACPANTEELSMARDGIHNCVCRPGFEALQAGVACGACADGSHKASTGSHPCELCPAGTYQPLSAGPHTANTCQTCPQHSSSLAGSSLVAACVCLATFNRNASACVLCKPDHFCLDQNTQTRCPLFSTAAAGSVSVADCRCDAGFSRVGDACQLCRANTYCLDGVAESACPLHSTTLGQLGSVDRSACVCDGGFFESDAVAGTCSQCGANTFCANDVRLNCPSNASAPVGSTSVADCLCDALFRRVGDACVLCGNTQVCRGGGSAVLACAGGAVNEHQLCVCAPGSYCPLQGVGSCLHPQACPVCPEGSFCAGNNLTACAPRSSAPAGSASADACVCVPGSYRNASGECELCPRDSYCFDERRTLCSAHDANLVTENAGASTKSACVCRAGDFRLAPTDLCKPCPLNFYCPAASTAQLSNVYACLENEFTAGTGSTGSAQCLCEVGFLFSYDEQSDVKCMRCAPGERCSGGGVVDEQCHVQSRVANADHSKCLCLPGFYEDQALQCVACAAPTTKAGPGDFACEACAAGTFWHSPSECLPCAANATSEARALACVCRAPQIMRDGACGACPAGTFLERPGLCVSCPADSSTAVANYESLPAVGSCLCNAGFERLLAPNGSVRCAACAPDTYESAGACVPCGAGASSAPASSGVGACECNSTTCGVRVWDEFCAGGCEPALPPCALCEPGHAKALVSASGNTDPCLPCPLHTFQERRGASGCEACHATRNTADRGSFLAGQCLCRGGWEHVPGAGACRACTPGHAKGDLGDYDCSACPIGTFAEEHNETECDRCDTHSPTHDANTTVAIASDSVLDCTCEQGYYGETAAATGLEQCVPCVLGSFKDAPGFHACDFCGTTIRGSLQFHNSYGHGAAGAVDHGHCRPCPPNSGQEHAQVGPAAPMQSEADCLCMPGFDSFSAAGCLGCGPHLVRLGFGPGTCAYCAAGHAFITAFQPCQQCVLASAGPGPGPVHVGRVINRLDPALPWATSPDDCACDLGYARQDDLCHACPLGTFRSASTDPECSPCALDFFQNTTASTACHACPPHSFTRSTGSTSVRLCVCVAGYEWDDEQRQCVACLPGHVGRSDGARCEACPDRFFSAAPAQTQCDACGAHEFSLLPRDSPGSCACDPGFGSVVGDVADAVCSACEHGSFSAGGTEQVQRPECQDCPAFKNTSQPEQLTVGSCVCVAGHGVSLDNTDLESPCTACTSGKYAPGGANVPCVTCGFGTVTEPSLAAAAFDQCMCNARLGLRPQ